MEWSIVYELVMDLGYPKNLDFDHRSAEGLHILPNSGGGIFHALLCNFWLSNILTKMKKNHIHLAF